LEYGVVGVVGGGLGGAVAAGRRTGLRFWALALAAGGALALGGYALREARLRPSGDAGGPVELVLAFLIVGWLLGALLGVIGAAVAQVVQPFVDSMRARFRSAVLSTAVGTILW